MTGSLNIARVTQTATLLTNGTTLVAGGFDASASLASAELYEPGMLTPAGVKSIKTPAAPPVISPATYQRFNIVEASAGGRRLTGTVNWRTFLPLAGAQD